LSDFGRDENTGNTSNDAFGADDTLNLKRKSYFEGELK
jgi:hypothetical protein